MKRATAVVLCALGCAVTPRLATAQIVLSISLEPPELPVYEQPALPDPGYIWTPGYWAYGPEGYFWVPGTWIQPPQVGYLWTPGYWGWGTGNYLWHTGYWGQHVGFYGGVNYGYGYGGSGYQGGQWDHGNFSYNRAVNNFGSTHVTNVYNRTVIVNNTTNVSYNGGTRGTRAQPTPEEVAAVREPHLTPTSAQQTQVRAASTNHALLASVNHGHPPIAATRRPGEFKGAAVTAPRGQSPASHHAVSPADVTHPGSAHATRPADTALATHQAHAAPGARPAHTARATTHVAHATNHAAHPTTHVAHATQAAHPTHAAHATHPARATAPRPPARPQSAHHVVEHAPAPQHQEKHG
jgi:hypothetical protein